MANLEESKITFTIPEESEFKLNDKLSTNPINLLDSDLEKIDDEYDFNLNENNSKNVKLTRSDIDVLDNDKLFFPAHLLQIPPPSPTINKPQLSSMPYLNNFALSRSNQIPQFSKTKNPRVVIGRRGPSMKLF